MKRFKSSLNVNILFTVIAVSLIVAVLLVNGIAMRLSERYNLQIDLTEGAVFEIGDDTKALLSSLDVPVEIFVLSDEGGFSGSRYTMQAKRIIDQYPRYSGMISLEFVDYMTNPGFAVAFPELPLSHGDIVVKSGDNVRHILGANLFHFSMSPEGSLTIIASRAEEALSSAIVNVLSDDIIKVAILTGNGAAVDEQLIQLLIHNNYEVNTVPLHGADLYDFDAALLLAPTIDLSEDVVRMLDAFLYNDGRYGKTLFYTASPSQGDMPNLDTFMSEWGVRFLSGAVFETNAERTYQHQPFYPTAVYEDSRLYNMLRDPSMPILMPLSRPMEVLFNFRDGYFVETLLSFSETSGVRPADASDVFTADDATLRGPLPALVISSFHATTPDGATLLSNIVFSSSTIMFDPIALHNSSLNNAEFLLNMMGEVTDRDDIVHIQPKSLAARTLGITSAQASTLGTVLVGVIPLIILLSGVVVWLYRRYK